MNLEQGKWWWLLKQLFGKGIEISRCRCKRAIHGITCSGIRVCVAGGFDPRLSECFNYCNRLEELARRFDFRVLGCAGADSSEATEVTSDKADRRCVLFLKNISSPLKLFLLKRSVCVLYTPTEEHFGIVSFADCTLATLLGVVAAGGLGLLWLAS